MVEEDDTTLTQRVQPFQMKEISCKEMLYNLMTDEGLTDSALEGDDGISIKVNRFALAARSAVFRRMLFGEFVESKHPQGVVKIGFHSTVLRAVVEYIHTDSATILEQELQQNNDLESSVVVPATQVQTLVSMTAAGMYFHLPGLSEKSHHFLSQLLETHPALSFAVLEGCKQAGPSVPQELETLALSKIRSLLDSNIPSSEIAMLSPELMEEIVRDPEMETYELELFKLLQVWAEAPDLLACANNNNCENPPETDSPAAAAVVGCCRREMASKMTHHIQLEHIDPLSLSTIVASSGLVTPDQLLGAYKLQALAAQEHHNIAFNRHRKMPVWESVHDSFRKCLKCPPIRSGTHRWTLEVEEHGRYLWLGIVHQGSGALYAFSSWSDGVRLYINESYGNPHTDLRTLKLATGSKVTFVLNMTPSDSGNGTLCASVNGGPLLALFSDLLDRLDNNNNSSNNNNGGGEDHVGGGGGFVPAMCLKSPASVSLVSMEKV